MNRTQRAVKRKLKKALKALKCDKHRALGELRGNPFYDHVKKVSALSALVREEKGLKEWHRKILTDYACPTSVKEEAAA